MKVHKGVMATFSKEEWLRSVNGSRAASRDATVRRRRLKMTEAEMKEPTNLNDIKIGDVVKKKHLNEPGAVLGTVVEARGSGELRMIQVVWSNGRNTTHSQWMLEKL